jgi:hypothetical protein
MTVEDAAQRQPVCDSLQRCRSFCLGKQLEGPPLDDDTDLDARPPRDTPASFLEFVLQTLDRQRDGRLRGSIVSAARERLFSVATARRI